MAEQNKLRDAKAVYNTVCRALDKRKWNYTENAEKLTVDIGVRGDDLLIELKVNVDAEKRLVLILSHMPFIVSDDKRIDVAVAVSAVNNLLVDGCFDYDIKSGHMFFRLTNSYIDSTLGEDVFQYMLSCACSTIDEYNDKFLLFAKGMIKLDQFLSDIKN